MTAEFDPDVAAWLAARARDATAADLSIDGVRRHSEAVNQLARARITQPARPAVETDVLIDATLAARVFRPAADRSSGLTIAFFHGGGWIAGSVSTHLHHARRLCVEAGAVVVSVDYRLAPEHPFPAAFDDCMTATRWVARNVAGVTGPLVVAGDSAGGQLAASVAIACRDEGLGLAAQLLIVPVVDTRGGYQDERVNARYPSRASNDGAYGLTSAGMAEFVGYYAPGVDDWRVSPLLAPTLAGVAPALVHTAGFDVLRDEGVAYAAALRAAGVPVVHRSWPTLNHGFFGLGGVSAAADLAAASAAADLVALTGAGATAEG